MTLSARLFAPHAPPRAARRAAAASGRAAAAAAGGEEGCGGEREGGAYAGTGAGAARAQVLENFTWRSSPAAGAAAGRLFVLSECLIRVGAVRA